MRQVGKSTLEPSGRIFYRIVRTDPPELDDFLSYAARGRPAPNNDAATTRLWDGISVYDRESRARRKGKGFPWRGRGYIADLHLADDIVISVERTGRSSGHFTLWGDPQSILRCVARVVPIYGALE